MPQFLPIEKYGWGADGPLVVSANATDAPVDSACTGAAAGTSLSATNASFAANQRIAIYQTQGTGAGQWEQNIIASYVGGTITTRYNLDYTYASGAQVLVIERHATVDIDATKILTAKAWNGTVGGIVALMASTYITVAGDITGADKGFRGGQGLGSSANAPCQQGEDTTGIGGASKFRNGMGAGAGENESGSGNFDWGAAGGGGHATAGQDGPTHPVDDGQGGLAGGTADLTTMVFGGAGGQAGGPYDTGDGGARGGYSGAIILLISPFITITGGMSFNGETPPLNYGVGHDRGGAGGGAGGSVLCIGNVVKLGAFLVTATKGLGTDGLHGNDGGDGSDGRIRCNYGSEVTGTTSPALSSAKDTALIPVGAPISVFT